METASNALSFSSFHLFVSLFSLTSTPVSVSHWLLVSLPAVRLMIQYLLFRLSKDEHCVSSGLVLYTKTLKTADVTVIQTFPAEKGGCSHAHCCIQSVLIES